MPSLARHRSSPCAGSVPSTSTCPAERLRKPSRISIVVVLPAPFGPSNAITSPRRAVKSTPHSTSVLPYRIRRSRTSIAMVPRWHHRARTRHAELFHHSHRPVPPHNGLAANDSRCATSRTSPVPCDHPWVSTRERFLVPVLVFVGLGGRGRGQPRRPAGADGRRRRPRELGGSAMDPDHHAAGRRGRYARTRPPRRRSAPTAGWYWVRWAVVLTGSVVTALPLGFAALLVGRAAQGVGLGLTSLAIAIARDALPAQRIGPAVSVLSITTVAGIGLGYPLVGVLTVYFGLAAAYWAGAAVAAAALLAAAIVLPPSPDRPAARLDTLGAALLGVGVAGSAAAMSEAVGWPPTWTLGLVARVVGRARRVGPARVAHGGAAGRSAAARRPDGAGGRRDGAARWYRDVPAAGHGHPVRADAVVGRVRLRCVRHHRRPGADTVLAARFRGRPDDAGTRRRIGIGAVLPVCLGIVLVATVGFVVARSALWQVSWSWR